jgi:hypothetical protein
MHSRGWFACAAGFSMSCAAAAGEALELSALLSVELKQTDAFERNMAQLKPYYFDPRYRHARHARAQSVWSMFDSFFDPLFLISARQYSVSVCFLFVIHGGQTIAFLVAACRCRPRSASFPFSDFTSCRCSPIIALPNSTPRCVLAIVFAARTHRCTLHAITVTSNQSLVYLHTHHLISFPCFPLHSMLPASLPANLNTRPPTHPNPHPHSSS